MTKNLKTFILNNCKPTFLNRVTFFIPLLILTLLLQGNIVNAQTGIITTIAGTGLRGFNGDGGPAIFAQLNNPAFLALDSDDNIFIVGIGNQLDIGNQRIRKIDDKTGIITTIAGNGSSALSGDGGLAVDAALNFPSGVAVDTKGNIFIANMAKAANIPISSPSIRKIDATTGIITTVAGNGSVGFSGDGGVATEAAFGPGFGISFGFFSLNVFVDGNDNIFVSDSSDNRIRKIDGTTGIITTIVGNGLMGFTGDGDIAIQASISAPGGIFVDNRGNIFFADTVNHRIRKISSATNIITTIAGSNQNDIGLTSGGFSGDGGPATDAELNFPTGVFVDSSNNIYIADAGNNRIRKVDGATGIITTVAGNGFAGSEGDGGLALGAQLNGPTQIVLDSRGNMLIADTGNHRIRKVSAGETVVPVPTPTPTVPDRVGIINTIAGNGARGADGDLGLAIDASFDSPYDLFLDKAGNIFVTDTGLGFGVGAGNRVRRIDRDTGIITTVAGNGNRDFSGDFGPATEASFSLPEGLYVDGSNNIFIADSDNSRIRKVDGITSVITTVAGSTNAGFTGNGGLAVAATLNQPSDLFLDSRDNLLITDSRNNSIRKVDNASGIITLLAGRGKILPEPSLPPAVEETFNNPTSIFVDSADNIYIADTNDQRVRKIDGKTGRVIAIVAGIGVPGFSGDFGPANHAELSSPEGVFVDNAGNVFISDTGNNRIRRVDAVTGIITTIAGNGTAGFDGDGGLAKEAMLRSPKGLSVDGAGDIYFVDSGNNRIRRISFDANPDPGPSIISLIADDPDDGDFIYSDGDTITVIFSEPTNQPTASTRTDLDNLFTFSQFLGIDYLGTWTDPSTLEILIVNSVTATPPAVGALTLTLKESGNLRNEAGISLASTSTSPQLAGDFGTDEPVPTITPLPTASPQPTASPTPSPSPTASPEPTPTPTPPKMFTFNCPRNFLNGRVGLERLVLRLGENEQCTLKLTNLKPGVPVEVASRLRKGLRSAIRIEPERSVTNAKGELEIIITALHKGIDWAAWTLKNDKGRFEFSKKMYDQGIAWGMFVEVQ